MAQLPFVKPQFVEQHFVKLLKADTSLNPSSSNPSSSNFFNVKLLHQTPLRWTIFLWNYFLIPAILAVEFRKKFWQFWQFWFFSIRPIFEVKIGVVSWVSRGRRPRPANPNFNTQKIVLVMRVVLTVGDER
jgi:hypothetical protein